MGKAASKYEQIIEKIFWQNYSDGDVKVPFEREQLVMAGQELGFDRIKNLGDIIYSFRFRRKLPVSILETQPSGMEWLIYSVGIGQYEFQLLPELDLVPKSSYEVIELLDSTPGVIAKFSFTDEQALLAVLRYNRIVDIFLGITCYSLQSHLKTSIKGLGSMETDELYIGIDKEGRNYVIPVEAKGGNDKIGRVQIDQDFALCDEKFSELICIPVAAQFLGNDRIALFRFTRKNGETLISEEKHYQLIHKDSV